MPATKTIEDASDYQLIAELKYMTPIAAEPNCDPEWLAHWKRVAAEMTRRGLRA